MDPDLIGQLAPMALMALPMIASALAGLAGGGVHDGEADTGGAGGGLSPESQKALHILNSLAAAYGDGPTENPEARALPGNVGAATLSGDTAIAVKAKQLYLVNAAGAFNNVDNGIAGYLKDMAGRNNVDKKAIRALLREVNVKLAELKWQAYTKAGQQKVRDILTVALQKGQRIVAATQANTVNTAAVIDRLSDQYLYNIYGRSAASGGPGGASSAAHKAVRVATAQLGDPYIYGAEGPNAFDCSGLMQYAAAKAGIKIPRVAAAQYRQLPKVRPSDIRPGDLIFPAKQFNGGWPKHVMMYIGNGRCVSAPYSGAVVHITPLPDSYHATRFA
ncbi:NlpC/P60 family protein [Nocardia sp. NPDC004168]|uniref:NlpC/P60 family protein n=1 Tax=Nocardia sp. NPDC004168 TaxID=3154452 RepID=UPI0033AAEA80